MTSSSTLAPLSLRPSPRVLPTILMLERTCWRGYIKQCDPEKKSSGNVQLKFYSLTCTDPRRFLTWATHDAEGRQMLNKCSFYSSLKTELEYGSHSLHNSSLQPGEHPDSEGRLAKQQRHPFCLIWWPVVRRTH